MIRKGCILFKACSEQVAAIPPLNIHEAACVIASDYHKKKHVLRLKLRDNSEFLLEAPSQNEMVEWLGKIKTLAGKDNPSTYTRNFNKINVSFKCVMY